MTVFGSFTYKSYTLGKTVISPFYSCQGKRAGKTTYFQFMEDTLATTDTFKVSGTAKYHSDPNGGEVEL